jgi:hypothetical protein
MKRTARTLSSFTTFLAFALFAFSANAQSKPDAAQPLPATLPDIIGIRPGMSAQEAYNLLKARHAGIKIGVGQSQMQGFGEKPVFLQISAQVVDASAPETISVWLTAPPGKQVVFAVGRTLEYDPNQPLLRTKIVESLRQKFGPETQDSGPQVYWAFDEQGKRPDAERMRQLNCLARTSGNLLVDAPPAATFNASTPIIYSPQAVTPCDSFIRVHAELTSGNTRGETYVNRITLLIWDLALQRRSQESYQAYLASLANAKGKEELDKAKQRTAPSF